MNISTLQARVEELLIRAREKDRQDHVTLGYELLEGALSLMSAVYGPESNQILSLRELSKSAQNRKDVPFRIAARDIVYGSEGALANLKAELDAGLSGSLKRQLEGSVLTDFIQLARSVLDEQGDNAKNVAAVLAASAFEDTIRRMAEGIGESTIGVNLSDVVNMLKAKGVLQAPQLGIAVSYLSFRNHALHANWDKIELASVHSVLGFVEQLLLKHFQ